MNKDYKRVRDDFKAQGPADKGPDLLIWSQEAIGDLLKSALITEVDLGAKASEFEDVAVQAMKFDGKAHGMPYTVGNPGWSPTRSSPPTAPRAWRT